ALLSEIAAAPLQVGVYLLLGIGRARDVVVASVPALVVNLALSLILVHVVGMVGVFIATLVGSAVLTPPVLRAMLRAVDSNLRRFVTDSLAPALPPLTALLLVASGVVALGLRDIPTIAFGALAGGAVYLWVAKRWSLDRSEIDELKRLARRRTA